jgi:hypothetical protein
VKRFFFTSPPRRSGESEDSQLTGWPRSRGGRQLAARHIVAHIRRKGEPPLVGRVHGRPRRWVVERTNSWHNRYRALLIRWERKASNYLALVHLTCALIALKQSR